jgi:hypothetical protein
LDVRDNLSGAATETNCFKNYNEIKRNVQFHRY